MSIFSLHTDSIFEAAAGKQVIVLILFCVVGAE